MIFGPILNFPELKSTSTITRRSGTGTVQLDPHSQTVSIKAGKELITAKYLGTALQSGDSIRYTLLNDILLIEKIPVPDQTDRSDCFIRQQPTDLNKIALQIDSLLTGISSDKTKQEVFSILESLAGLPSRIDPVLVQEISFILQTNGELNSESTERLKNLLLQIKQAISTPCLSRFMELPIQNLPGDIYKLEALEDLLSSLQLSKNILFETGTLTKTNDCQYIRIFPCGDKNIAAMISADSLQQELKSLICDFASPQMQSVPVSSLQTIIECRNQLNLHLLNAMDTLLANMQSGSAPKRAGSESAQHSTLTQWLLTTIDHQSILPELVNRYPSTSTSIMSAMEENSSFFPAAENFGITEELLSTIKRKEDLIPTVVNRLGFNFDRKLSEPGFSLREKTSLKELILGKIIDSINGAALPQYPARTEISEYSGLSHFLDNVYNEFSKVLDKMSDCNQLGPEIKKIVQPLNDSLSQLYLLRKNYFQSDPQINSTDKEMGTEFHPNLNEKLSSLLSDLVNNIKLLQNSFQTTGERSSPVLFDYLFKFGQRLNKFIENHTIDSKDFLDTGNHDPQNIASINNTGKSEYLSKPISIENAMIKDSVVSNQLSKPFLDSLLNRLESLQLLSRPISTTDGTQQVLALPMNVGGEWTEVNIHLVKKRNGSKKKVHKSFYRVELNIAPSKLGTISVQMEYEIKKRFNLKISFGKNQTLEWFSKNRNAFGKSLCNLGLPLFDFQLQSEVRKRSATETYSLSNAALDVKI